MLGLSEVEEKEKDKDKGKECSQSPKGDHNKSVCYWFNKKYLAISMVISQINRVGKLWLGGCIIV